MLLNSVEPKTSKLTGGVNIDLFGTGLVETQFVSNLEPQDYSDSSSSAASVVPQNVGIKLKLPDQNNQRASVDLNKVFNEAFELRVSIEKNIRSFPLINKTKGFGIEVIDQTDISKRVRAFIEYRISTGYLLVVETWDTTSIIKREELTFDPKKVDQVIIKASGKYVHGYVSSSGKDLFFGKSSELSGQSYKVRLFSENPESGVAVDSEIIVKKAVLVPLVSFAGYPAKIIQISNEQVRASTIAGEISFGDIIFSGASGTVVKLLDEVRYTNGIGAGFIRKRFDTVQAVYNEYVNPSREKLFSNNRGFVWDEDFFLSDSDKNNNLHVPSLWDPSTGNIPADFFQSGVGPFDSLKFLGIEKKIAEDEEKWFAKINHGTYFISNVPYYLFSDESIIEFLGEKLTEDGRSYHPLKFKPKNNIPIVASSLTEEVETKRVIEDLRLQKRGKFTGEILNGVELDSSVPENIDKTKEEFIVKFNSNNEVLNWRIPVENTSEGVYVFTLPEIPLEEFRLRFSRKDIFKTQKTIAKKYGEDTYDSFLFGEGISDYGDYAIDYRRGIVEVILERSYSDLGYVSYTFDYPAIIEFNNDYTKDIGTWITNPSFSDLSTLDNIGMSLGTSGQKFRLSRFPVVDYSTITIVDNYNFKLFVYDEFDNSFETTWKRVTSLEGKGPTEKVYTLNSSDGTVVFGNGINGEIPGKYKRILVGYKPTLKIQYEPENSSNYWSGKTVDLNLSKQTLNSGFLYISRKNLVPGSIELEFASRNIGAFETTDLNATVYTQEGEVVPDVQLQFEIVAGGGELKDLRLLTNPNGQANTIYTPSSRLEDIGIRIDLFEEGSDSETPGESISGAYGDRNGIPYLSLKAEELIQGNLDEMYLFKILDDGDDFLPYNNETRKGGRLVLYHQNGAPVRGSFIAGTIMGFENQLPQPYNIDAPNYEKDLRGFFIVGKKTIQARAFVELEDSRVYSDIVTITVEYSPLQKGIWRLPTPPIDYESSQINTATYINI